MDAGANAAAGGDAPPTIGGAAHTAEAAFLRWRESGDTEALAAAFEATAGELRQRARRTTACEADAADLVQGAFLVAIQRASAFDGARRLMPWLVGIVDNLARHLAEPRPGGVAPEDPDGLPGNDGDPTLHAQWTETRSALRATVQGLPRRYREVVELHLFAQMSAGDIGHRLGRPAATVRTQLARGLQLLRRGLPSGLAGALIAFLAASAARAADRGNGQPHEDAPEPVPAGARPVLATGRQARRAWIAALVVLATTATIVLWGAGEAAAGPVASATATTAARATPVAAASPSTATDDRAATGERSAVATTATVRARLSWQDGAPAAGASVRLNAAYVPGSAILFSAISDWQEARADAGGLVEFHGVRPGLSRLFFDDAFQRSDEFTLAPGDDRELTFTVQGHALVLGKVVDGEGRPVAGAEVWVSSTHSRATPGYVAAHSDADGAFAVRTTWHEWSMWVRAKGWAASDLWVPRRTVDRLAPHFVLDRRPCRLSGRVLEGDRIPAAGMVAVCLRGLYGQPVRYLRTDGAGRFEVDDLPAGAYVVAARTSMRGGATVEVDVAEDAEAAVEIALGASATVRGQLLVASGTDLTAPCVGITPCGAPLALRAFLGTTAAVGPDGRFVLPHVTPGKGDASVYDRSNPRSDSVKRVLTVGEGEVCEWNPVVGSRHTVRGRVLDGDGDGAAGARVRAVPEGFLWEAVKDLEQVAVVDAEGRFELALLSAAPHLLFVQARSAGTLLAPFPSLVRHDVRPDQEPLDLRLTAAEEPASQLDGRVLLHDGSAAKNVVVEVWRERVPTSGGTMTGPDGAFALGQLPPSDYHVFLRSNEAGTCYVGRITLGAGANVNLGTRVLAEPAHLLLRLFRDDGAPVRPGDCEIVTEPARQSIAGFTAVPGSERPPELQSRPLPPGEHWLRLYGEDFLPIERRVAVAAGRTTLDLRLQPAARFILRLHGDVQRGRTRQVRLAVLGNGVSWRRDLALDEAGAADVALGLAPGSYAVTARSPLGTEAAVALDVAPPDGVDREVELRLR